MGASESVQVADEKEEEEENDDDDEEEEDEDEVDNNGDNETRGEDDSLMKKVLEQEPEMLPCHASASPLSPQLSSFGTPRLGPSIKVWDPYNVLSPPPSLHPPPHFTRTFSSDSVDDHRTITELYLICHGECHMNLRPDLVGGRCPEAALTPSGKRQARALAVFLKSQGIRFNAVYTSPLDRARATALPVCQEMNFSEHLIQASDALQEMSQGLWEGCQRSDVYTPEMLSLMERFQPDFCAPSGESLRQVEFRMLQFLNGTVVCLPEKLRFDFSPPDQDGLTNSIHKRGGASLPAAPPQPQRELLQRPRQGLPRRKSSKSRLQIVTTTTTTTGGGDHEADDEMTPREHTNHHGGLPEMDVRSSRAPCFISSSSSPPAAAAAACVGVFTHSVPIKCLLTGLLSCSPIMSNKISIEDSSVTVLQHSWKLGWQIKRLNDTSHLRLL